MSQVLLCHGLSSNRFSFDVDENNSLARTLVSQVFATVRVLVYLCTRDMMCG